MSVIGEAFFFDTEIHKKHLYDTRYPMCADYKFLIEEVRRGERFLKIERPLVNFDPAGLSKVNRVALHAEKRKIRKMYPKLFLYYSLKRILRSMS